MNERNPPPSLSLSFITAGVSLPLYGGGITSSLTNMLQHASVFLLLFSLQQFVGFLFQSKWTISSSNKVTTMHEWNEQCGPPPPPPPPPNPPNFIHLNRLKSAFIDKNMRVLILNNVDLLLIRDVLSVKSNCG